jgi:long-subunit acyl-CoA synthetase (AMP-forming)
MGDGQASLTALIVPVNTSITDTEIQQAINQVNQELPDYAQMSHWLLIEPMTPANGLVTVNGRPKRQAIEIKYKQALEGLYTQPATQAI